MNPNKLKPYAFALALLLLAMMTLVASATGGGSGAVSLTALNSAFTQNFDTLSNSTLTTNDLTITGWYLDETGTSATNNGQYKGGTGSDTAGDVYSFGVSAATERALGTLLSGTLTPIIGAKFTNNTGATITSLDVAYTGEMWRAGVTNRNAADQLDFQLSINATGVADGVATWTDYNTLDYASSNINATSGALVGNNTGNKTAISATISSLSIANGASFWIRWTDFNISGADDGLSVDDFSITPKGGVVDTAPTVSSTTPTNGAPNVALAANIDVTFSEAVTVSGAWYTISCANSGSHTATVSGGPTTFTLDPDVNFSANETCTVTIVAAQVADQDGTADNMAANYVFSFTTLTPPAACGDPGATLIHDVQGNGGASPLAGSSVTIEGVIVGDFQDFTADPPNELNGYVIQEEDGDVDADPNTSEGILVFEGANPSINYNIGDKLRLTGTVTEFGDAPDTLTEITSPTGILVCSTGNTLPTAATIDLPVASLSDYEAYESMLVTFSDELTVTEVFTLGRFGEVLLSAGGRLWNPTHAAAPGAPAQAVRDANILRSIILDDGLTNQNPDPLRYPEPGGLSATNTLRGGDTVSGLTGVMHYLDTTEDFRVQPTGAITWNHVNPRPADAPLVGGTLTVTGLNTLNFFTTLTTAGNVCGPLSNQGCRGANSSTEFTRQRDKLINALVEMNADVFGLVELENNASANPANNGSDPVLQSIVNGLNGILGAGTYDFIDTGTIGGDAIKVGLIYKPATVTPVGSFAILDSSVDPNFIDTRNRPVLAQTFEENGSGETFTVAVAHLKSKGSDCGGAPDDQPDSGGGNCNGTRTAAAQAIVDWFASDPTGSGDDDYLLVGDLNSYAMEDPIQVLLNAGYADLAADFNAEPYSYVFDGEWGYLDYAIASPSLAAQVTDAKEWHINSDEPIVLDYNTEFKSAGQITSFYSSDPFRISDHDPILVGLGLTTPDTTAPTVTVEQASGQVDPTSASPINFTVVFSEPVIGFATGDVTLGGTAGATTATVTEIAPNDGTTYNVAVSGMTANGTVTASVGAAVAKDAAGNDNTASTSIDNQVTYTGIDDTPPDTTIDNQPSNPSNSSSASFFFSGSDNVGVASFECSIDGGGYLPCTSPYTIAGLTDGSHTFQVRAKDAAGNVDPTPASYTWTIDTTAPSVTINQASGQADPTSASPINFTVVFSEPVTGFATGDVTLGGTAGATTATVTEIAPNDGTTYNVAVSGMTADGTVIATVGANVAQDAATNGNAASTSTDNEVTYVKPVVTTAIFVSTTAAGNVGPVVFGSEDILKWDGSAWSVWFDGSAAGLTAARAVHNLNAVYIPDPNGTAVWMAFTQNARYVDGIPGKVDGMDIVQWDGSTWSLVFDGQDVGLTVLTQEKVDGLHVLDASLVPAPVVAAAGGSCQAYLLISTAGPGKVPGYTGTQIKFGGEDVLGFCATQLGATTTGKWFMVLDGTAEGMPLNSLDSISASDDGQVLYLTTRAAFNVDSAVGGHSMVYKYDFATGLFSGPYFSAPANGLTKKVDGLHVAGDLP